MVKKGNDEGFERGREQDNVALLLMKAPEENAAKVSQSVAIMKAFRPQQIMLIIFGRLPFQMIKKNNGLHMFRFRKFSFNAIYFYITSAIFSILFGLLIIGYITMYFRVNVSKVRNRCGETWEQDNLKKTVVPTALTVGWMYLTFAGSLFIFLKGKEYIHYMNYWNKAITVIDVDPTEGARMAALIDIGHCVAIILVFTVCYISYLVPSLHDGAASIANAIVRLFVLDIGVIKAFSDAVAKDFENFKCEARKRKLYISLDYDTVTFGLLKFLGFFIQIYSLYGSMCFIMQFQFYCRLLKNVAFTWNERYNNALHGVEEDAEDPTKRRLRLKLLMKDHLIVVQMFKLTEAVFSSVIRAFFSIQIISLCCELYFLTAMTGISLCEKLLLDMLDHAEIMKACFGIPAETDVSQLFRSAKTIWFSDPCASAQVKLLQEASIAMILLFGTIRNTFAATISAAEAHEEAMRGFDILRKHCYMHSKTRKERNFVHSLIFSFARTNPIHISAGNYFAVNKALLGAIIGSILTYYIILLQFKPGQFDTMDACITKVCSPSAAESFCQKKYNLQECYKESGNNVTC